MDNYIIFNKKFIKNLKYEKLISNDINFAIMECICKNLNIIYVIEENDIFNYFGANSFSIDSLDIISIENKKNFLLFINIHKCKSNKYISKFYENNKYENIYFFHSKLINLNESYKDSYQKILKNINKKNNFLIYFSKNSDIYMHFTNYIFDVIYINNNDFNDWIFDISDIKIDFSKIMILNMNYLIFLQDEDIFKNTNDSEIWLSNNNKKYKNFACLSFKNLKKINDTKENYLKNIDIIKLIN
jgi:hypothetical protein